MYRLLYHSQNDFKLEQIGVNQSSIDLNHDSVSLIKFSPGPCFELEWISTTQSQVQLKNLKKKKKVIEAININ